MGVLDGGVVVERLPDLAGGGTLRLVRDRDLGRDPRWRDHLPVLANELREDSGAAERLGWDGEEQAPFRVLEDAQAGQLRGA
jgi:hypothetical protein